VSITLVHTEPYKPSGELIALSESVEALCKYAKSILNKADNEQQKIFEDGNFASLNDSKKKEKRKTKKLEKSEVLIEQLESLRKDLNIMAGKVEVKSSNTSKEEVGLDEMLGNLNHKSFEYIKKDIRSSNLYKNFPSNVKNRIDEATSISNLLKIVESRDSNNQLDQIFGKVDLKMEPEVAKVDLAAKKIGKQSKINPSNVWELVDIKQSTSVSQPEVTATCKFRQAL
jgi:hypothetical protein